MKSIKSILLITISCFLAVFFGCERAGSDQPSKDDIETPISNNDQLTDTIYLTVDGLKVSNGEVVEVGFSTVKIRGDFSLLSTSSFDIIDHGHVVSSKTQKPTIENNEGITNLGERTNIGAFDSFIADLKPGTRYFGRVFIKKRNKSSGSTSIGYHDYTISFNTKEPEVANIEIESIDRIINDDINNTYFVVKSKIVDFKGQDITDHGIIWTREDNENLDISNYEGIISFGRIDETFSHSFQHRIERILSNTGYKIKAYTRNSAGFNYSGEFKRSGFLALATYKWPKYLYKLLYEEDFSSNFRGWRTGEWFGTNNASSIWHLSNGVYKAEANVTNSAASIVEFELDHKKDFDISFDIRIPVPGPYGSGFNFCFDTYTNNGSTYRDDGYSLRFFQNGFNVWEHNFRSDKSEKLINKTSILFNANNWNRITIRKANEYNKIYFFVNEEFIRSFDISSCHGPAISFLCGANSKTEFDNLTIHNF